LVARTALVYEIETITHHKQPHIPPAKHIVSGAKRCVFARQRIVSAAKRLISERQRIVFDAERLIAARKLIIPDAEQIIFAEKRIVCGAKLIISPVERIIRSCARRLSRNPDYRHAAQPHCLHRMLCPGETASAASFRRNMKIGCRRIPSLTCRKKAQTTEKFQHFSFSACQRLFCDVRRPSSVIWPPSSDL